MIASAVARGKAPKIGIARWRVQRSPDFFFPDDEGHECDGDTGRSVSQLETGGSLRQEGPVVGEEGPRWTGKASRFAGRLPSFRRERMTAENPRAAPALATQYPGLDDQLNRQIEASRRHLLLLMVLDDTRLESSARQQRVHGHYSLAGEPRGGSAGQVLDVGPRRPARCSRNGAGVVRIGGRSPQGPRRKGRATPPSPDADKSPADEDIPNGPPRSPGLVAQLTRGEGRVPGKQ